MILSSLIIKNLYGNYDYNVSFNPDITLLYGENGCGKTTILNIITAIITGKLYQLFSYDFKKIILNYFDESNRSQINSIEIERNDDFLEIKFRGKKEKIPQLVLSEDKRHSRIRLNEYFEEHSILEEIRKEFNYIYLALDRCSSLLDEDRRRRRMPFYMMDDIVESGKTNDEIHYVKELIFHQHMVVTTEINRINDEFKKSILKSALDLKIQTDIRTLMSSIESKALDLENMENTKNSYIDILTAQNLISEEEKGQYQDFFDNYFKRVEKLTSKKKKIGSREDVENFFGFFVEYNEMRKITHILDISDKTEKQKEIAIYPIKLFLDTVNDFFSFSRFKKKISITEEGKVYFSTEDNEQKLSIKFLSSGEKQILVFFANLIFGVKRTSSGIFVVDEPELSLHLYWQKIFIEKALDINNKVQFIFATHAPEIIGKYRDKMEKLDIKVATRN